MNANILIYTLFLSFLITQISYAQQTFSRDAEKEVIVQFTEDALAQKGETLTGKLSDFTIASEALHNSLDSAGIKSIGKLRPEFKKEDRFVRTRNGKQVILSDWSNVMLLRIPENISREKFINRLNSLPEVVYAEANAVGSNDVIISSETENPTEKAPKIFMPVTPDDEHFNRQWALKNTGTSLQGSGTSDADIDADQAWDITTGSSSVKIGIIDNGVQNDHPDLIGKVTGSPILDGDHGTFVAGIAAAQGDNTIGIAGVAYNASIIDEWSFYNNADWAVAIANLVQEGAHVINASWGSSNYSKTLRKAIRDAYIQNRVFVTSSGNKGDGHIYPGRFKDGVITVGGTRNEDDIHPDSRTGSWVDVVAPMGGGSDQEDKIYSTYTGGNYGYYGSGTSWATPQVSGIAALLLSEEPTLYNDDIENLIEISAEDVNNNGFDNEYGHGRVMHMRP